MRFAVLAGFALLAPLLGLVGAVEAVAHGLPGIAALASCLLAYGLATEYMVRRRSDRAFQFSLVDPAPRSPRARGQIRFTLRGSIAWSWDEESVLPRITGRAGIRIDGEIDRTRLSVDQDLSLERSDKPDALEWQRRSGHNA